MVPSTIFLWGAFPLMPATKNIFEPKNEQYLLSFFFIFCHMDIKRYFFFFFGKKKMLYCGNPFAACGLGLGIWGKCNPFLSHRTVLSETKRWISLLNSEHQILQNSGDSIQHISSSSRFFPTPSAHSQVLHARHSRRCSERFLSCEEKNVNVFSQHLESTRMAENMTPPFP